MTQAQFDTAYLANFKYFSAYGCDEVGSGFYADILGDLEEEHPALYADFATRNPDIT